MCPGREYKCRSFKMPTRGERVYMLSMDPARVLGFRDSYLFFLKNPQLVRVNTTVEERTWMIEKGMLMANFKSKLIAVVTARSIFKSFGHRIIKKGKNRIDDYYESLAAEDDPAEDSDDDGTSRTDDGRSQVNGDSEHKQGGSLGKRKHTLLQSDESTRQVTDLNWLYESALAVRALNAQLQVLRKENPKFMDPHTNIEQIPASTQPTNCSVTAVPTSATHVPLSQPTNGAAPHVLSIPRSIGPQVDAVVKVEIKGAAPAPPVIQDPRIWAVIPENIRKALEDADALKPKDEENADLTKYPLSILDGHFQAAFPVHQARFQQPYRVVLPKSMAGHAQYIHHLYTLQSGGETAPIMEQATLPGQVSAQDVRMLQWQQHQQQQQQQAQQQQMLQQQAKLQQQQQEQQAAAAAAKKTELAVMNDSQESAAGGRGSRARRQPSSPAPRPSSSRQSSRSAAVKPTTDTEMAPPSPSRTRRTNARSSSVASVGTVKEATRKSRSTGKSSLNSEPADEEIDEEEDEESDEGEELEATSKRSSRPTRSKKPSRNGPVRNTSAKPQSEDEDKDEDEDADEKDEAAQPSVDKNAPGPKEEEPAEDVEEIEGEIEEAGEAKITKDGELLG
ncbi:hypothetical protein EC968_009115, partial [Mortierella alpina]